MPGPPVARDLARRLGDLGYSVDGIRDRLGAVAADALDRNEAVPARRVLDRDQSPLATAINLFLLAQNVSRVKASVALGPLEDLADLLRLNGEAVASAFELAPCAVDEHDWLVAADWPAARTEGTLSKEHVLGVGGASTLLAQCTVRPQVQCSLDIGTGCGIQSFHLWQHSSAVVATDVSRRCLTVSDFNFAMNGMNVSARCGDLYEPVTNESFDLIVSNPPFVIGSPAESQHDYRDSGMPGDDVCAALVRGAAERLNPGGWCQLLANWEITDGDDWAARPRSWLGSSKLDAWFVQRDVRDPAAYIENWLRDSGDHWGSRVDQVYDTWLQTLEARGVLGIGFGLVTLRAGWRDQPIRRYQHVPQSLMQPIGPDVERWFLAQDVLEAQPGVEVLLGHWRRAADVEVVDEFVPGQASHARSVHRRTGFCWSAAIDAFGVELLARADGVVSLGEIVTALAIEAGTDPAEVLTDAVPVIHQLVAEGFIVAS